MVWNLPDRTFFICGISLTVDRRFSTLLKCFAHLSNIASLSMRSVLPPALSIWVLPELFGPLTVFSVSLHFFVSSMCSKDWISSAFLIRQKSCRSLSSFWTVYFAWSSRVMSNHQPNLFFHSLCWPQPIYVFLAYKFLD